MKKPEQHPSKIFWFLYCWLETNIRSLGKFPNWGNHSQEILKKNSWYSRKRSAMKSRCRKITNLNPVTSPSKDSVIDVRPRIFFFFFLKPFCCIYMSSCLWRFYPSNLKTFAWIPANIDNFEKFRKNHNINIADNGMFKNLINWTCSRFIIKVPE